MGQPPRKRAKIPMSPEEKRTFDRAVEQAKATFIRHQIRLRQQAAAAEDEADDGAESPG